MKKLMILALLASLAGCNTVAGVGDDISTSAHRVGSWLGGG
ncbi:entericidin [bacterium]|nr:entericidin [bacterium]